MIHGESTRKMFQRILDSTRMANNDFPLDSPVLTKAGAGRVCGRIGDRVLVRLEMSDPLTGQRMIMAFDRDQVSRAGSGAL